MYQIPAVNAQDEFGDSVDLTGYEVPRPLPIADKNTVGVKIQKLDGKQWLFINASTAQVWPRTQYFLAQYNLGVETSNAAQGIIDTEWLAFSNDKSTAVRYRIFLEKGIHPDTTEIHLLHMQHSAQALRDGERPQWPQQSDDPEREAWMLEQLAKTLADSVDNNAASLLGQNVGGELKAGFDRYQGELAIKLRLSPIRSWATMLHATKEEGYKTWVADNARKIFYVGYAPYDEDGPGFFEKLAFWSDHGRLPDTPPVSLDDVLANLSDKPEVRQLFEPVSGAHFTSSDLENGQGYLIVMREQGGYHYAVIRNVRGEKLPESEAKMFLRILRKNLI